MDGPSHQSVWYKVTTQRAPACRCQMKKEVLSFPLIQYHIFLLERFILPFMLWGHTCVWHDIPRTVEWKIVDSSKRWFLPKKTKKNSATYFPLLLKEKQRKYTNIHTSSVGTALKLFTRPSPPLPVSSFLFKTNFSIYFRHERKKICTPNSYVSLQLPSVLPLPLELVHLPSKK